MYIINVLNNYEIIDFKIVTNFRCSRNIIFRFSRINSNVSTA